MKIYIDGQIFHLQSTGGISRIYKEIIPKIVNYDQNIEFCITYKKKVDFLDFNFKKNYYFESKYDTKFYNYLKSYVNKFIRQFCIKNEKDSVWHSTYYHIPDRWSGKVVLTVPDLIHEKFPQFFNSPDELFFLKIKKEAIFRADKIISISEVTKEDLIKIYGISSKKIEVIPLGISKEFENVSEYCGVLKKLVNFPYFLYVGKRNLYKNANILLHAFKKIKRPEYKLILVGPALTLKEEKLLKDLKISDRVLVFSNINDKDLAYLYKNAKSFVYTSLYEGFGIPIIEAAKMNCTIVSANIPSSLEIIRDGAIYFDPYSVDSLIQALQISLKKNAFRIKKAENFANEFSWEKCAKMTLNLYNNLI